MSFGLPSFGASQLLGGSGIRHATRDDIDALLAIMRDVDVGPHLGVDTSKVGGILRERFDESLFFLVGDDGYIQVEPMDCGEYMLHAAAKPAVRGTPMVEAGKAVIRIALSSGTRRVNAWIERANRRAAIFAVACGMRRTGRRFDWHPENYDERGNWYALEVV